ncbi:unnamed protein product [Heligmosomoides polygyrus]|uniref:EB domain-containing protein n=1 Tax=Heligmosomoides polygyrus TaxID=6339 RepID=A0A183GHG2_HELPZ|nr:unnamed protein product [Heligmosomoides polygyrus]
MAISRATAEVACYHCFGNSTSHGQYCSIDQLCLGDACYFTVEPSGVWSSGCANTSAPPSLICSQDGTLWTCRCTADLCNQIASVTDQLSKLRNNESDGSIALLLPSLPISCLECGNVSIAGRALSVPCAAQHVCKGEFCVTKRGNNPHSYCGTSWDGTSEARCFKNPGEEEQCVCPQPMCNAVLSAEAMILQSEPTLATPTAGNSSTTAPSKAKKCKNSMKFSPNAQAVFMGEKLGQAIREGLGSDSQSVQEFSDGIDTHICN